MTVFHCDHCRHLLFFENTRCVSCDRLLLFLPDLGVLASLDPVGGGGDRYASPLRRARGRVYKPCVNSLSYGVCNWGLPADEGEELCEACRLTSVIPDPSRPENVFRWGKLEAAKRRLLYTLRKFGLKPTARYADPVHGLTFQFLADADEPGCPCVLTGHADGVVTVNIAEADDAERERRRVNLNEPFRTVIGHLRHEVGHYYWDRLVRDQPGRLTTFRHLFGDDRQDYAAALTRHYKDGPPADWATRYVSAYATMHPWEDWAESFAHYLHLSDALQTAAAGGVSIRPPRPGEPAAPWMPDPFADPPPSFDALLAGWHPLAYLLNNLTRGLGLPDGYPFVLNATAVGKLRFVHDTVTAAGRRGTMPA